MVKSKQGTYYLGRVHLIGLLDKNSFIDALKKAPIIEAGNFNWTITDFKAFDDVNRFYFGKLTKYEPVGTVDVIDPDEHIEKDQDVDNRKIASSPFVYLPDYSGIAFLHVWNQIEQATFIRRFTTIVKEKFKNFMVECEIEAVSDITTFKKRLLKLSSIDLIQAKVHPPNPLFGPLWKSLKEYLDKRKAAELRFEEKAEKGEELQSKIKELLALAEGDKKSDKDAMDVDITDAAILMATDGYGRGKVQGIEGKKKVVIHTQETVKNFKFDTEPEPLDLYNLAEGIFKEISEKRHMEHDKKD